MARGKKKESALTPEEKLAQALVPDWEQPYKVPKNWCWVRLEKLYEVNPKNNADDPISAAFIPMEKIEPGMVSSYTYEVQPWGKARKGHTQFADGDVAFAKISPCFENRKSMIVADLPNGIGGGTTELIVLRQAAMNQKYTFWFISDEQFIRGGMATYSGTVGQQRISMDYVRSYPVPVPPITEQQRIVDRIEYLFAKLDEAKEKAQSVLDSFETRKAAVLHKAFTGELTAKWRMENGVTLVNVEKVPLGKLTGIISSKRIYKEEYVETGVPFFRSSEVVELHDYGMTTPEFFISRQRYEEIKKQYGVPSAGDLLVTSVGTIGKTWIVDDREFYYKDGNLTQVMQCESLDMKYLQYFIKSEFFKQQVSDTVAGSAYNALTIVKFKKILIPLVGLAEQTEIVRILDSLFAKEQQAKEAAEAVLEKIDLLKKSILVRAFRGELGTNDPAEESAMELLKQVLEEDAPTVTRKRSKSIPKELQAKLATELERKIIKLYFKQETDSLPAEELLSVSSKKFEVMGALHNLEQAGILKRLPNGDYRLLE